MKITSSRKTICLVVLSLGLAASCQPAPSPVILSSTPAGSSTTPVKQDSATPSPGAVYQPQPSMAPTPAETPSAMPIPAGWKLVWHDEFNGPAGTKPNSKIWSYDLGAGGWGNGELQYYTDRIENAALDGNGSLALTAFKYADPHASGSSCSSCSFSSARLVTRDRLNFTYGRFEARMRLPTGQGLWPAFWLLGSNVDQVGWPQCGEIDVMENKGSEPAVIRGSLHGPGYADDSPFTQVYTLPSQKFTDDFHVFIVEWNAAEIRWYVDGKQYYSVTKKDLSARWVFDHPFYLILNLSIGGAFAGSPGNSTVFPQTLFVDYIRVYQQQTK